MIGEVQMNETQKTQAPIRAAQYVRMSTEHQQYSTDNQKDTIREFADKHGMEIVKTYADDGKSGLNIEGRESLQKMLNDVATGVADYSVLLVYDVSRFGRFQNPDESAYYEHILKRSNIYVEYCAEQFRNDGTMSSTIVKTVKRAMAGEYSRELSNKVFQGQCRLIHLGYRQGGMAGYGLRRMLVDQEGVSLRELKIGQQKSLQTERVILVPGPEDEVETVNWIYNQFVNHGRRESAIAKSLNEQGLTTQVGRPWSRGTVNEVLTNEKYIGNNVYNRVSFKLKKKRVVNASNLWVRADKVFKGIVDPIIFYKAKEIIEDRNRRFSNDDMLGLLKHLYHENGFLSGIIIDQAEHLPPRSLYVRRFGSLLRAYKLVGYTPDREFTYLAINRHLRDMHPEVVKETITQIEDSGGTVHRDPKTDLLRINNEFTASLVISRCRHTRNGASRWIINFDASLEPDITIAARMDANNERIQDYYLLPSDDMVGYKYLRLSKNNGITIDVYRFDSLDYFFNLSKRIPIWQVA